MIPGDGWICLTREKPCPLTAMSRAKTRAVTQFKTIPTTRKVNSKVKISKERLRHFTS